MTTFFRKLSSVEWLIVAVLLSLLLMVGMSSCNRGYYGQPGYAPAAVASMAAPAVAAPVVVEHDSGMGFFSGMLAGHLMSGGFGHPYSSAPVSASTTHITKNVTINKNYGEGTSPATMATPSKPLQKPAAPPSFNPSRYSSMSTYRPTPKSYGSYRSSFSSYRGRR